jgi:hypothetical protein
MGCLQIFREISMEKGGKKLLRIKKEAILIKVKDCVHLLWGNPIIFAACGENPMIAIGFSVNITGGIP